MLKIERLLSLIIYLLNNGCVSAKQLSERFGVSVRTVLRDIDTLTLSGIPIVSSRGAQGGYYILPQYKWGNQLVKASDYEVLLKSVKALDTALDTNQLKALYEKLFALSEELPNEAAVNVDFGVAAEEKEFVSSIEKAIKDHVLLNFDYLNSSGQSKRKRILPNYVIYKWYAWYMIGFDFRHEKYFMFKLRRMHNVKADQIIEGFKALPLETIMTSIASISTLDVTIKCTEIAFMRLNEYLKNCIIKTEKIAEDEYMVMLKVPANELHWFTQLIGLGGLVEVLSPQSLRTRIIEHASGILKRYEHI